MSAEVLQGSKCQMCYTVLKDTSHVVQMVCIFPTVTQLDCQKAHYTTIRQETLMSQWPTPCSGKTAGTRPPQVLSAGPS